jgi:hypothetical protein
MTQNLLLKVWTNLDSQELRLLLQIRLGGHDQFDNRAVNLNKFYLPLARERCRIVLTYKDKKIVSAKPGPAFDAREWESIANPSTMAAV